MIVRTEDTNKQEVIQNVAYNSREHTNQATPIGPCKMETIEESNGKSGMSMKGDNVGISSFPQTPINGNSKKGVEKKSSPTKKKSALKCSPKKKPAVA